MAENALSGGGIWALAGKPTVALKDPNESLRDVLDTQQRVVQNRLARAAVARGAALQQSVNPLTGLPDMAQANKLMAADPDAGLAMPEALNQSLSLSTGQADLGMKQADYMGRALGASLKLPQDQQAGSVAGTIGGAVRNGLIPQSMGNGLLGTLSSDPATLGSQLQVGQIGSMSAGAGRDAIYGTPTAFNRGGTTEFGTVAPADQGGGFNPTSSTSMTLTPGERTTPQQIGTTPTGAPVMGTRQQYIDRTGGDIGAPGGGGGSPLGNGRFPQPLLNPNRLGGAAPATGSQPSPIASAAPSTAASGGGIVMGPGPAQQAAMTRQGGDSAGAFQQISDQGVQARSQSAVLGTMLADTANFDSGESYWNNIKTNLARQAPGAASLFGIAPGSVAAMESFDKFAAQLANAQGAGSDARLAVNQSANPSSKMSKEGLDQVIRQLQGNADYLQARARLAAAHPEKDNSAGFEATTGAQLDPRAFQVYRMTPAQRQTYDRSLSDADRKQVEAAYNFAHDRGLFTAPAAAAAPQMQQPAPAPARPPVYIPPAARGPAAPPVGGALRGGQPLTPGNNLRGY